MSALREQDRARLVTVVTRAGLGRDTVDKASTVRELVANIQREFHARQVAYREARAQEKAARA